MKVDSINNNLVFGNKNGGVKYLRILTNGEKLQFVNATHGTSDVGVFVAGGPEVDKKVLEANHKTMIRNHSKKTSYTKHNSLLQSIRNILNF